MENKELDLTYVKIANARSKSLKESRSKINGEMYVSHDPEKRKKIEFVIKSLIGALVIAAGVGVYGLVGTMEYAGIILDEVAKYDDPEFKADMLALNDFELNKLFHDTHKQMMKESGEYGPAYVEPVVARMEEDHDLKTSMSK